MNTFDHNSQLVDITPTPKILRTLGDIPFAAWQCLAELTDNSLDAFADAEYRGLFIENPRVDIYWSSDSVSSHEREIVVQDNGNGMPLDILQSAAKAGYSSNDPIHNLGLFGMGFNISTARLGDETLFLSATPDSDEWVGIRINFEQLIKDQTFSAPIVREPKKNNNESGTKIIIRNLKDGIYSEIKRKESIIRRQLESIYSPILNKNKVSLFVQGKKLFAKNYCIWSDSRFVIRKGLKIEAVQQINRDLGDTYFDKSRNRYLLDDEITELELVANTTGSFPEHIVKRARRLKGWIGVQRYSDTVDYGIDFVRNGRKILVSDKCLFGFENPDTGTIITEYPVELGSTVGGRLVGELHVDYLIPTYQKNGFDTTDRAWRLTLEAVRGAGPILPKSRAAMGYDGDNTSPLGKLVNAYRRIDPGTKNLAIANSLAKDFSKKFYAGELEYESDDKWFKVAQEADRARSEGTGGITPVNSGDKPSDEIDDYIPKNNGSTEGTQNNDNTSNEKPKSVTSVTSLRDELIQNSDKEESLSMKYSYDLTPGMDVTAWRVKDFPIKIKGNRVPCHIFIDGIEVDFFFDPTHPILAEYPITAKQLLLQGLAEKYSLRNQTISIQDAYVGLVDNHLTDERINYQSLQERAHNIVSNIKERLPNLLNHRFSTVKDIIREVDAEEEELARRLIDEAPHLLSDYQNNQINASQTLSYICDATVKRLIERMPEEFMDNKLFAQPYLQLKIGNESTCERLRKVSLDKILSYISDIVLLLQGAVNKKQELLRHANTLSILEGLIE
ncbi:ATP-binding protein [Escherichia coli]|uniref:ATP-binding protein n=4 Tax=Escherichia coli TaxID=562 RepID=UPI0006978DFC|nr:ATP-binding protein [Escherichia coli]EEV6020465.1 ATP-binding protein [Escherichia coli]EEW1418536.1 ATP-binding protein [Escherichia coli]EEY4011005.1 ATP-binding protein [Escherichia coli]EFA4498201.1 ATP-binding protein [Escherichia coli]EFB2311375.1 ATP-binding protein [Escherichia coli]